MGEVQPDNDRHLLEEDTVLQLEQLCKVRWQQSQTLDSDADSDAKHNAVSQLEEVCKVRWQESQTLASAAKHGGVSLEDPGSCTADKTTRVQATCSGTLEQRAIPHVDSGMATAHSPLSGPQAELFVGKDEPHAEPSLRTGNPRAGSACQPLRLRNQETLRCSEKHCKVAIKVVRNLFGLGTQGPTRQLPEFLEAPSMAPAPWLGLPPTYAGVSLPKGSHEPLKPAKVSDFSSASEDMCEGSSSSSLEEEESRTIFVHIAAEVDPYVAELEDGKLCVKAPFMRVSLSTSSQPPGPHAVAALLPKTQLDVPLPGMEELEFDPVSKMPNGCRCEVSSSHHVGLMELPTYFGASLRSKTRPIRGILQLQTGQGELTAVNFAGDIQGKFSMVPGKRVVSLDLEYKVICALSGAGSARFTRDGRCLEPPITSAA